ncbi:hypothetical protein [Haloactinospora alba]|uniref:hypothetical protein n=1 Tax=Haloactinospora alba TaxID=405555 RepID=UPI0011541293|nr:hypothetical protein [Haloactinospora alba]
MFAVVGSELDPDRDDLHDPVLVVELDHTTGAVPGGSAFCRISGCERGFGVWRDVGAEHVARENSGQLRFVAEESEREFVLVCRHGSGR